MADLLAVTTACCLDRLSLSVVCFPVVVVAAAAVPAVAVPVPVEEWPKTSSSLLRFLFLVMISTRVSCSMVDRMEGWNGR